MLPPSLTGNRSIEQTWEILQKSSDFFCNGCLQVIELPETMRDGSGEQRVLALVSEQNSVTTLPDSADARELLAKQPFHFWAHEKSSGRISSVVPRAVFAGFIISPCHVANFVVSF